MNVVSLLPSATEILYALGVEPVAVSHECDYPNDVKGKPRVTSTSVDPDAASTDINSQVAEAMENEGVYDIHVELLRDLDPDMIVTQGVCEVCAVDSELVEETVHSLESNPQVIKLHPHTLNDVLDDIMKVGNAVGKRERATDVLDELRRRINDIEERCKGLDQRGVVVLDWMDPVMVAGHWVPELVELAGGSYGMGESGEPSRPREWREILDHAPESLLVAPCGYELEHTVRDFNEVTERQGWRNLPAVKRGRVYAMDGHNYVNRPGPRLVDTLEIFAQAIHPDKLGEPPADAAAKPIQVR